MIIVSASLQDSLDIWTWRNASLTRSMSITADEVSFESHSNWFEKALKNPNCFLYLAYSDEGETEKVGMCRFDIETNGQIAKVSLNLNPKLRGKGLSHELLSASVMEFWKDHKLPLNATIKTQNVASIKCFIKCILMI